MPHTNEQSGLGTREAILREAAQAICNCCLIDGDPRDCVNDPDPTGSGGPRFIHEYPDGREVVCGASAIWQLAWPAMELPAAAAKPTGIHSLRYVLRTNPFGRWVILKQGDERYAWSGAQWVGHAWGLPTSGVQICNFESAEQAHLYAQKTGLETGEQKAQVQP